MADYTVTLTGETNKAVKRDARRGEITVEALLLGWLKPNLDESLIRYNLAQIAGRLDAYEKAAPETTIAAVRAGVNPDTV